MIVLWQLLGYALPSPPVLNDCLCLVRCCCAAKEERSCWQQEVVQAIKPKVVLDNSNPFESIIDVEVSVRSCQKLSIVSPIIRQAPYEVPYAGLAQK